MTSIRDVAREAGVAISTVSKVLNNYPNVSQETKDKVEDAVRKLHFVPNAAASTLSSKQPDRVAVIINSSETSRLRDEINMQYISGAITSARSLGTDVCVLFSYMAESRSLEEMIQYLRTQNIGGIVVCTLDRTQLKLMALIESGTFPTVVIDAPFTGERISSISIDNRQAQYDVASKMITGTSCRSILYIAGGDEGYVTEDRLNGIRALAREKKLRLMVRNGHFSEKQARTITKKYAPDYDAIVCASDMMAIGAMRELIEMDIFRPVSGFDGLSVMGYAGKQMFTVKQDFSGIAAEAIREEKRLMSGAHGRKIVMPYRLARITYEDVIE